MSFSTTRLAVALVAAGALALGLNGPSTPSVAAPNFQRAPNVALQETAGTGALRAKPHGRSVVDQEYFTVRMPASGNYHVTMTGFALPSEEPASYQCLVVDKKKALASDESGYYLLETHDTSTDDPEYNIDLEIDVSLKKERPLLIGCLASVKIDTPQQITYTFRKNGAFRKLPTRKFTVPQGGRLAP